MMGVAKLIRELDVKPRRTIRVVLFANEEFGTSGSLAYLAANEAEAATPRARLRSRFRRRPGLAPI